MTIRGVIQRIKKYGPVDELDLLADCGLTLTYVASGCFRNVYTVAGLPIVIKVPNRKGDLGRRSNLRHAKVEHRSYRVILEHKALTALRQFLPKIYYMDDHFGVTVMHKYERLKYRKDEKVTTEIGKLFANVLGLGKEGWDYHLDNFGKDENGKIVLVDLGCLEGYPCD